MDLRVVQIEDFRVLQTIKYMAVLAETRTHHELFSVVKAPPVEAFNTIHIDTISPADRLYVFGPNQTEIYESRKRLERFKMELKYEGFRGFLGKLNGWVETYFGSVPMRAQKEVGRQIVIRRKLRDLHQRPTLRGLD